MAMESNYLKHMSTGKSTYWPTNRTKSPDLVDFCYQRWCKSAQACFDVLSHHLPVLITINTEILERNDPLHIKISVLLDSLTRNIAFGEFVP